MLDRVVHHLRANGISFRLSSQPSPEPLPEVAQSIPPGGLFVETRVLLVAGRPAVAVIPRGAQVSLPALTNELSAEVIEGSPADLPPPFTGAAGSIPPLGSAMGVLTMIDTRVSLASAIVFTAFSPHDAFEIPFDEYARLERPRISSFAVGGELPESGQEDRKAA
jgi:prolyl-tRNA editing enzyme YbaK/EbsC (Cys-tRNA(Pro) deacylase)